MGWELGAGNGHTTRLLELAASLSVRGHEPICAPQQIGPFAAHWPTRQAPVWPRLLGPLIRRFPQRPATMGDVLAYLGLDDPDAMAAMIMAWDRIILDERPDVIVTDYAPMLQLAAKGRVPTLAMGTGFTLPPAHMTCFPGFFGNPAVVSEGALLATLNDALGRTDRQPIAALPEIFASDRSLISTFEEFDPYRQWRREPVGAPTIRGSVPFTTGAGDELFVYLNGNAKRPGTFWQGLGIHAYRSAFMIRFSTRTIVPTSNVKAFALLPSPFRSKTLWRGRDSCSRMADLDSSRRACLRAFLKSSSRLTTRSF